MADGDETPTARPLRRAAPTFDGPLASSGAAPEPARPAGPAPDAAPPTPIPVQRAATDPPAPAQPDTPAQPGTPAPPTSPVSSESAAPDPPEPTETVPGTPATPAETPADLPPTPAEAATPADPPAPADPATPTESAAAATPADSPTDPATPADPATPDGPATPNGPAAPADAPVAVGAAAAAAPARRRIPSPRRLAARSVRATRDWSRRPAGKLAIPGLSLLLVVVATGVAGAVLVPAAGRGPQATGATATPEASLPPSAVTPGPGLTTPDLPGGLPPLGQPTADPIGGAPGEVLTDWATQVGQRVVISEVAMRAYGYAELVLARTTPGCQLTWTTLAAIGLVESNHGRANGATLQSDGLASPHIIGLPLDGKGDRQLIADTDDGAMDGDPVYDRAVGPMQFIPTTWDENGADADNDGVKNPHDIDDAALAAGNYLCKGGRDLSTAQDWWNAILSYNDVRPYAQAVFEAANRYGTESRT